MMRLGAVGSCVIAITSACAGGRVATPDATTAAANTLSATERAAGWRLLFDGTTFAGWRGLGYDSVPTAHWKIENGAIKKIPTGEVPRMADGQPEAGGDLMTSETFRD